MTLTSAGDTNREYAFFESAPVAMWEEDFTLVLGYLQELDSADLGVYLQSHPEAVSECMQRIRVVRVNKLGRAFYGSEAQEHTRRFAPLVDPETIDTFRCEVLAFASGLASFEADIATITTTGEKRLVRMNCAMQPTPGAPWSSVIVVFTDITQRHGLEQTLKTSNEALVKLNKDLEQFAYAAAHDLREPLRTISLYTQLLENSYSEHLGPHGRKALQFIRGGATRMERLVWDLLGFAHVLEAPEDSAVGDTDSQAVVPETLVSLEAAIQEAGAEIRVGPLPAVAAESSHVRQLFQNLISNSLKYRDRERALLVTISAQVKYGFVEFVVSDNGEGIRPEYFDKIFQMFQRLHGQEVQGSGIGLALCTRIVELYGGRIWVESEVGTGSKFFFTLPVATGAGQTREGS
ncbi:MAG: hypothetical protein H7039_20760 [Bryobacteraceae bacterium]|nr:hypothetical protein [Bryobacteraceae bacterium]